MRRLFVLIIALTAITSSVCGQWRKIANFKELVHCVYFIDLGGPPRIGFTGTESNLYKTTNGGASWYKTFKYGEFTHIYISDICFKDSLIGWFLFNSPGPDWCYRTTDGGETWKPLNSPPAVSCVSYIARTNQLIVGWDTSIWVSTDLGDSWSSSLSHTYGSKLALFDSVHAAANVGFLGTPGHPFEFRGGGLLLTSNGGISWDSLVYGLDLGYVGGGAILPISGTPTGFSARTDHAFQRIFRTDDYGHSWSVVSMTVFDSTRISPDIIEGDLSALYLQSDSGMFRSTDEGVTWRFDGGPEDIGGEWSLDRFYSQKGVTIAGRIYANGGFVGAGGLWQRFEEDRVAPLPSNEIQVSVVPNPTHDHITLDFEGPATYQVQDLLGVVRMRGTSVGPTVTLDCTKLAAGTYLVRVANGTVGKTVKFVKE